MKRKLLARLVPAAVAYAAHVGAASADVYAFVDSTGVRHLSNVPSDPRYKLVMRTPAYRKEAIQVANSFAPTRYGISGSNAVIPRDYDTFATPPKRPRLSKVNDGYKERLTPDINRIAAQNNLDPALMHAVISAESGYNPWAVSPKGAMGLMQLMPGTAERFGVSNAYDPVQNMQGGARYLRWLLNRFNDTRLAVAGYNAGEGAVDKYGRQIPPYSETQNYVVKVMGYYDKYKGNLPSGNSYANTEGFGTGQQLAMNGANMSYTTSKRGGGGGPVVITPRKGNRPASITNVPESTFDGQPSTYFQPTGQQIIVGNSQGNRQRVVRVTIPGRGMTYGEPFPGGN